MASPKVAPAPVKGVKAPLPTAPPVPPEKKEPPPQKVPKMAQPLKSAFEEIDELAGTLEGGDPDPIQVTDSLAPPPRDAKPDPADPPEPNDKTSPEDPASPPEEPETEISDLDSLDSNVSTTGTTTAPEPKIESLGVKQLRDVYGKAKTEIETLRARITELENLGTGDLKATQEKLKAATDRLTRLDYTNSDEFKEKYVKPLAKAIDDALEEVGTFTIEEGDSTRSATKEDFYGILRLATGDAHKRATELFGSGAGEIMALRRNIINLRRSQKEAEENAEKHASSLQRTQAEEAKANHQQFLRAFESGLDDIASRRPALFKPGEDEKEQQYYQQSRAKVMRLFDPNLDPEERLQLNIDLSARAVNFTRIVHLHQKALKRIEELEARLQGHVNTTPAPGQGTADKQTKSGTKTWQDEWKDTFG